MKKVLSLATVIACATSLVACSGNEGSNSDKSVTLSESTEDNNNSGTQDPV